ncbi:MAG: TonB-dependent receptor [Deltaproteobacteria bacterium]|nr:TonB-dependent receptor [Deltaproteobacteria bacterium]
MPQIAILLGLVCFLAAGHPAWAEEVELPEVSVTATRSERETIKLARNVTVIGRDEIEALNPLSVTDLLEAVPGLVVRDYTGTGALASVDLRGFGDTGGLHTLVTVDGRRINQISHAGVDFTTIPVENIERIEILHGPAGVLYGDSAVGGVINIVTKEGVGPIAAKVRGGYGSYEAWGGQAFLQGGADEFSYFVSARYHHTDGYRDNSETELAGATFNTRFYANPTLSFLFDGGLSRSDYSLPGPLTEEEMEDDRRQSFSPEDWADNSDGWLRGQVRKDFGGWGVLTTDLSYRQRYSESEVWSRRETGLGSWGLQPKWVVDGALGSLEHRITVGIDYYSTQMTTDIEAIGGPRERRVDYRLDSLGVYLLEEINLTPDLLFSLGGRWQQARYDIRDRPEGQEAASQVFDDHQYALSLGLTYNFNPETKVYGRLSRAFRYPTVEEYLTYGQFCRLDPETVLNYELGWEYNFMPGGRISAAGYLMDVQDEIAYNPATWANENLEATRHAGLESSLRFPVGERLSALVSLTFQAAEFTAGPYEGNRLPLVPDWMASAGLSAKITEGLNGLIRVDYIGPRPFGNDKANQFEDMEGYFTVDLHLNYHWNRIQFFFNVANLFNQEYSTYGYAVLDQGYYYPEPGTLIWGGLGVTF